MPLKSLMYLSLTLSLFWIFTACSTEVIKVGNEDICQDKFKKKTVEIDGVLVLPSKIVTSGKMIMNFKLEGTATKRLITASFGLGVGNNRMEKLPSNFTIKDVKILDKNGKPIKVGEKVRIVGEMYSTASNYCHINVEEIENI
ncbi:MAG TPA: hypothetical protein DCM08_12930 [Microscillaceae bacterium]|nr:hypothetical protein [Microscillaceae bacterium]